MLGLNKKEIFVVLFAWAFLTLLNSWPYLYANRLTPPGKVFTGNFSTYGDLNNYYSYFRQAYQGQWLFRNINTPEPHDPVYFNLEYLIVGKTAYFTGMSIEAAFHLWRVLVNLAMLWVFFLLSKVYFSSFFAQVWLLAFFSLSSGFGWIVVLFKWLMEKPIEIPLDAWSVLHPFNQMLLTVHITWANVFDSLGILFFIKGMQSKRAKNFWISGVMFFINGFVRPFSLIFFGSFVGLWMIINIIKKQLDHTSLLNYGRCLILPIIALTYNVYIFKFHPVFKWWSIQNIVPVFGLATLSLFIGLPLLLAVIEFFNRNTSKPILIEDQLLYLWVIVIIILVYCNQVFTFAYQFITLFLIPLHLIAGGILFNRENRFTYRRTLTESLTSPKLRTGILALLLIISSLTSVLVLATINRVGLNTSAYLKKDWLAASQWIEKNSPLDTRIIASNFSSNFLSRYTGRTVFLGYHYSTVDFKGKTNAVKKFFSWKDLNFNQQLLQKWQIDYVWEGEQERAYRNRFIPFPMVSFLKKVYNNKDITIYKVKNSKLI